MNQYIDDLKFEIEIHVNCTIEEKIDLFAHYIYLYSRISNEFNNNNNKYVEDFLLEIYDRMSIIFESLNFEHVVYEKMYKYLNSLDKKNIANPYVIDYFEKLLNVFDKEFINRTIATSSMFTYILLVINSGYLSKIRCELDKYESLYDDEFKTKTLNNLKKL